MSSYQTEVERQLERQELEQVQYANIPIRDQIAAMIRETHRRSQSSLETLPSIHPESIPETPPSPHPESIPETPPSPHPESIPETPPSPHSESIPETPPSPHALPQPPSPDPNDFEILPQTIGRALFNGWNFEELDHMMRDYTEPAVENRLDQVHQSTSVAPTGGRDWFGEFSFERLDLEDYSGFVVLANHPDQISETISAAPTGVRVLEQATGGGADALLTPEGFGQALQAVQSEVGDVPVIVHSGVSIVHGDRDGFYIDPETGDAMRRSPDGSWFNETQLLQRGRAAQMLERTEQGRTAQLEMDQQQQVQRDREVQIRRADVIIIHEATGVSFGTAYRALSQNGGDLREALRTINLRSSIRDQIDHIEVTNPEIEDAIAMVGDRIPDIIRYITLNDQLIDHLIPTPSPYNRAVVRMAIRILSGTMAYIEPTYLTQYLNSHQPIINPQTGHGYIHDGHTYVHTYVHPSRISQLGPNSTIQTVPIIEGGLNGASGELIANSSTNSTVGPNSNSMSKTLNPSPAIRTPILPSNIPRIPIVPSRPIANPTPLPNSTPLPIPLQTAVPIPGLPNGRVPAVPVQLPQPNNRVPVIPQPSGRIPATAYTAQTRVASTVPQAPVGVSRVISTTPQVPIGVPRVPQVPIGAAQVPRVPQVPIGVYNIPSLPPQLPIGIRPGVNRLPVFTPMEPKLPTIPPMQEVEVRLPTVNPYLLLHRDLLDTIARERDIQITGDQGERARQLFDFDHIMPDWIQQILGLSVETFQMLTGTKIYVFGALNGVEYPFEIIGQSNREIVNFTRLAILLNNPTHPSRNTLPMLVQNLSRNMLERFVIRLNIPQECLRFLRLDQLRQIVITSDIRTFDRDNIERYAQRYTLLTRHRYSNMIDQLYQVGGNEEEWIRVAQTAAHPMEQYILNLDQYQAGDLLNLSKAFGMVIPLSQAGNVERYIRTNLVSYAHVLTRSSAMVVTSVENMVHLTPSERLNILRSLTDNEIIQMLGVYIPYSSRTELVTNMIRTIGNPQFMLPYTRTRATNTATVFGTEVTDVTIMMVCYGTATRYRVYEIDELHIAFTRDAETGSIVFRKPEDPHQSFRTVDIEGLLALLRCLEQTAEIVQLSRRIEEGMIDARERLTTDDTFTTQFNGFDSATKIAIRDFLCQVFFTGMYMRRWDGPGTPFPLTSKATQDKPEPDSKVTLELGVGIEMLKQMSAAVKTFCMSLKLCQYKKDGSLDHGHATFEPCWSAVIKGHECIRMGSTKFIGTSLHYLRVLCRETIPGIDLTQLDRIV